MTTNEHLIQIKETDLINSNEILYQDYQEEVFLQKNLSEHESTSNKVQDIYSKIIEDPIILKEVTDFENFLSKETKKMWVTDQKDIKD